MHPFHEDVTGSGLAAQTEILTIFVKDQAALVNDQASGASQFDQRINAGHHKIGTRLRTFSI